MRGLFGGLFVQFNVFRVRGRLVYLPRMALCVYYMSVFMSVCLAVSSQNSRVHRVFVGVAKFRDLAHLGLRNGYCIHTGLFRHAPSKLLYYKSVYDGCGTLCMV